MPKSPNRHDQGRQRRQRRDIRRKFDAGRMTSDDIGRIQGWFDEVQRNAERAIRFGSEFDGDEDRPMYWATIKCLENVGESFKQIDEVHSRVLPRLSDDVPEYRQVMSMRDRLTHGIQNIDVSKVKGALELAPFMLDFLNSFRIYEKVCNANFTRDVDGSNNLTPSRPISLTKKMVNDPARADENDDWERGTYTINMMFNVNREIEIMRTRLYGYVKESPEQPINA